MAKYNREFLLPYLKSVCAIEFAGYTLFGIGEQQKEKISELGKGKYNPKPEWHTVPIFTIDRVGFFILGLLFLLYIFKGEDFVAFSSGSQIALIIIGLIPIVGSVLFMIGSKRKNDASWKEYRRKMDIYEKIEKENEHIKKHDIPIVEKGKAIVDAELERVKALRDEIYGANIIPRKNRDISVAMYLYDLFSTSQKNDLDQALDQYDEDELEDELTELIHKQLEFTNKQNRLAALKDRELPPEERQSAVMRQKLEQLDASAEEKGIYSKMIDGIDAVMNFFAETQCL